LIQREFYSEPQNEKITIELSDSLGNMASYEILLTIGCERLFVPTHKKPAAPKENKVITANITNVTDEGNVTITFSSDLKIP